VTRDLDDALALTVGPAVAGGTGGEGALGLLELQRFLGACVWVERRSFEVLGSWVINEAVPQARVAFDVQGLQHAWHAELLAERLPAVGDSDPSIAVLPPSAEVDRLFVGLGGGIPAQEEGTIGAVSGGTLLRLVGLARVLLPRLVAQYTRHLQRCSPVADAPLARALRLVLLDDQQAWQSCETMVQALVRRPHDVAVVTSHQQALEELVAESGPGLVPWPDSGASAGR
jgi:hypothetical protein